MSHQAADDTYLKRVQALLDKAESTPYQAEAEALIAKAQELMGRHAIDEAMLAANGQTADEVIQHPFVIRAPYASAKSMLLGAVARANRCRVITGETRSGNLYASVFGHQADIDSVEVLYTALSIQAVRFMLAADVPPHDTARRFRHSFLLAFATRIGERLREADRTTQQAAQQNLADLLNGRSARSVSVILAERETEVDRAVNAAYPRLSRRRVSSSSGAGHASGRQAADRSSLSRRGLGGSTRALGSG